MDYLWFLQEIFTVVIIPLLGVLTVFIIKCVNSYSNKIKEQTGNELIQKYIGILNDIIITCVIATNQTYVEALKKEGKFDLEAQKKAFEMTYEAVKEILSEEILDVLSVVYEDIEVYIKEQIEFAVNVDKNNLWK